MPLPGRAPTGGSAGAQIIADVAPFEAMKLRMLNGAHSAIAWMGLLAGHVHVRQVVADPPLAGAVRRLMAAAATTLPDGLDHAAYAGALAARFANPAIDHACAQIATDGSQKVPQRIFAPAAEVLARGGDIGAFALTTAAWMAVIAQAHAGRTPGGDRGAAPADPLADALADAVGAPDPVAALGAVPGLGAQALFRAPDWRRAVSAAGRVIATDGIRAAAAQGA